MFVPGTLNFDIYCAIGPNKNSQIIKYHVGNMDVCRVL